LIHVVLDTNVYRSNPSMDNLHFKAIEKLALAGELKLHIPYVVLREFQTQQREHYSKDIAKAISGLSGLTKRSLDKAITSKLVALKDDLENDSPRILSGAEDQIVQWAKSIGADLLPLSLDQTQEALEAYFQGKPPLKSIKNREDIPDSFIFQSILKLNSAYKEVHFVSGDSKILEAATAAKILAHDGLSTFVESPLIQDKLKDVDLIKNIGSIVDALEAHEQQEGDIHSFLSLNIGEEIMWGSISAPSIPDDNHEATINSYYNPKDIKLDFARARYYGNGQFGIPFTLENTVIAFYYIFKSDYYCLNAVHDHIPSISEHNDHYFEAEEEFDVKVSGLISIILDRDKINVDNISESIVDGSIQIDEVGEIKLC
jgi:hypothetical protein